MTSFIKSDAVLKTAITTFILFIKQHVKSKNMAANDQENIDKPNSVSLLACKSFINSGFYHKFFYLWIDYLLIII